MKGLYKIAQGNIKHQISSVQMADENCDLVLQMLVPSGRFLREIRVWLKADSVSERSAYVRSKLLLLMMLIEKSYWNLP